VRGGAVGFIRRFFADDTSSEKETLFLVFLELSNKGSGIHGTQAPETIGRSTSHGCIRLANWDALEFGQKVLPGVHIVIR
jgi:lipoprotein-anchoring transpeptidase ErfK/SrfK